MKIPLMLNIIESIVMNENIIIAAVVGVASSVVGVFIKHLLNIYMPDKKSVKRTIVFISNILFRYVLIAACIIFIIVFVDVIDKFFIVTICLLFSILTINISYSLIIGFIKSISGVVNGQTKVLGIIADELNKN